MTEMLSRAEGLISEDDDDLTRKINQFMVMVTMESLYRKGLIKLYHENMSFGKDVQHRVVAEKIKGELNED
jgi:exosortase/archaeosortase